MNVRLKDSRAPVPTRQGTTPKTRSLMDEGWRAVMDAGLTIEKLDAPPETVMAVDALRLKLLDQPRWGDGIRTVRVRDKWTSGVLAAFVARCGFNPLELLFDLSRDRDDPLKAFGCMLDECYRGVAHEKMSCEERAARSGRRRWYEDLKAEKERRDW